MKWTGQANNGGIAWAKIALDMGVTKKFILSKWRSMGRENAKTREVQDVESICSFSSNENDEDQQVLSPVVASSSKNVPVELELQEIKSTFKVNSHVMSY